MTYRKSSIYALSFVLTLCLILPQNQITARTVLPTNIQPENVADSQVRIRAIVPPDTEFVIKQSAIVFTELELNDKSVISFHPSLTSVNITVVRLVLHGKSTINLTPRVDFPATPSTPGEPGQVHNDQRRTGVGGVPGGRGIDGKNGVELNISVQTITATDGALWIKTDGTPGGRGGDGGKGGKGSGPITSGTNCTDGGDGGTGGRGGDGGKGGSTAKVKLKVGNNTISPTQANGVAPSSRPAEADIWGTIVVSGAVGTGGAGGAGGPGGNEGEGRDCSFPATDANPGNRGSAGPNGTGGQNGSFVPQPT